jgi:hypothetical protein
MLFSGDGKSTPIFALSPIDGQILVSNFWDKKIGLMGSSEDEKGYFLDMVSIKMDNDSTEEYYFHINHAMDINNKMERLFNKYKK